MIQKIMIVKDKKALSTRRRNSRIEWASNGLLPPNRIKKKKKEFLKIKSLKLYKPSCQQEMKIGEISQIKQYSSISNRNHMLQLVKIESLTLTKTAQH